MPEPKLTQDPQERVFLVFVNPDAADDHFVEQELEGLVEAAGGEACGSTRQRIDRPHKAGYLGSGKVGEIGHYLVETEADVVVVDAELSGIQIRNLEEAWQRKVLDRTTLILDIFARRAKTTEGQLQVELAQLIYRLPRLMSVYTKFERQRGGIGMRGPGETQLESDRRLVNARIARLKEAIEGVKQHRAMQRVARSSHPIPSLSLVGYTSAGKSTLMNRLCSTGLLVDAMPFATLDPTTRRVDSPNLTFFLTDTVGFIRNLPTQLVAAFRATLEEVSGADLLLHVVDVSHPDWEGQRDAVLETLMDIGASDRPVLTVFNKIDALEDHTFARQLVAEWPDSVAVSAKNGEGMADLFALISKMLRGGRSRIVAIVPYDQSQLVEACHKFGTVITEDYREDGIWLEADVATEWLTRLAPYLVEGCPPP
ncbi:MAG: GTPase HflX [Chthonomonadaceae bacterium]|nr:GTPase HflX [Chthonomonadaceae bacterium]